TQAQQAFRTEPRNLTVHEGATAVLKCDVLRASGTVQWVKDGLLLGPQRSLPGFPRYSMIGSPKRGQYHLQIEKAQLEDDASYECQASRSESSQAIISSTAWVNVLIPPSKPYFEVDAKTHWVAGKRYAVTCVALDAKPEAEITFYKDGVELTGVESFTVSGSKDKLVNTHARVTVTALSYDNGRQLACHASSPASPRPAEARMTMRVFYPPQPPVIIGLEGEEVKAGSLLLLQCVSYGGNPLATLHWTKNGEVVSISWKEDAEAQKSISTLRLMISPADNQAELSCESANLVSWAALSVSRKITVLFEPAEVTLLGTLTAVEGQDLHLTCSASSSNPPVQIRWWLGHKELNASAIAMEEGSHGGMTTMSNMTHRVSREEDGLKLTCEAFGKGTHFSKSQSDTLTVYSSDNMAIYRCSARNEAKSTISAQIRLKVYFTAIGLKITAKQTEVRRGQTLTLECSSRTSNPKASISWSLGTHRLEGVERPANSAPYGGVSVSSTLALNVTSWHHNQRVICQAYSPVLGEGANTFFQLDVLYPPEFSPEQPTHIQVLEDDVATIPLLVSANPEEVSCIWLHHRELVRAGDPRYHWAHDRSLEILNVTRKSAGVYIVKCTNEEGETQTTIKLNVQYAPSVRPQKDPVLVNLGETADLICVADANPITSGMFTWAFLGETEVETEENTQEDESGLLTIHHVTRAHAGLYQCTADNGIAPPASAGVQLVVQFQPELQKGAQWTKVASRGDGTSTARVNVSGRRHSSCGLHLGKKGFTHGLCKPQHYSVSPPDKAALIRLALAACRSASRPYPSSTAIIGAVALSAMAVDFTYNSVTLEWIPGFNGGLQQRFRIRYRWDHSPGFLYADVIPPGAASFTVTGLQPATTYNFSVNALNTVGESAYADEGAVLTITTAEKPKAKESPTDVDSVEPRIRRLPTYWTVILAVVLGAALMFNMWFFAVRWKRRRGRTGTPGGSTSDGEKIEEKGSSLSAISNSNKYESGEKINAAAQRTLLVDSGSETDSRVYERHAAEASVYYYPTRDFTLPLGPHPQEMRTLDFTQPPVDSHGHVYEEVGDEHVYQDVLPSLLSLPPPLFNHTIPNQRSGWRPSTRSQQVTGRVRDPTDVGQPQKGSDLPFELRGELV
ncbi:hypothetical protein fugu_009934, partial [Takifugu bimaculatus]